MSLKVLLTIPVIPGFLKLQYSEDLNIESMPRHSRLQLSPALVEHSLKCVLIDQFDSGTEMGAWSRRYNQYIHFLFGETLPGDISTKDTITFSALVTEDLLRFSTIPFQNPIPSLIQNRLDNYVAYLLRHHDKETGGFGRLGHLRSRDGAIIEVDLRHTLWALISLWTICREDPMAEGIFRESSRYLNHAINALNPAKDRAYTYAALHRFLTTDGLSGAVTLSSSRRQQLLKTTEAALVARYSQRLNTWDADRDPVDRTAIDNALYTLTAVRWQCCRDIDLRKILERTVQQLLSKSTIPLQNGKQLALPFHPLGKPDLGSTVRFSRLLTENERYREIAGKSMTRLLAFVNDPGNYLQEPEFSYSWHLSAALAMTSV